jgi:prepilin-type N-terminal cleavage/methylation domain-containing protein
MRLRRPRAGFTLIEMMFVVTILGVLSAVAIPSFAMMIARSKTAEVGGNLSAMYKHAASYYASERSSQGNVASVAGHCTVDDAAPSPASPRKFKQQFSADNTFSELGFVLADFVYFQYGLASLNATSSCEHSASSGGLYTFYAHGDLDSDGTYSTFELSAGTDAFNLLYHARSLYIERETE